MKRKLCLLALVGAALLSTAPVPAYGDFYVVAGGGAAGVGTAITSVPYTITQPGFYYPKSNLAASGTAISIQAHDVTLDLMGFCLAGPGKASGATNQSMTVQNGASNVEIRNGSVKNFGFWGIVASSCTGIRVLGVRLRKVGHTGIGLPSGTGHVVAGCSVINAGALGIQAEGLCLVKGNHVTGSSGHGILTGSGSTVADNLVHSNLGFGIYAGGYCTVTGNTARNNRDEGIRVGDYSTVVNNTTQGLVSDVHCNLGVNTVY